MCAHWESQGYEARLEVPLHGRIADVLASRDDELVAVELKLEDWREALGQAMHYQLAAHRAYIAMPLHGAAPPLRARSRLERQGVGLLAVHPLGEVRTLVEAKQSTRRLPFLTDHLRHATFGGPEPITLASATPMRVEAEALPASAEAGTRPMIGLSSATAVPHA